jgi:hypothetical protein
VVELANTYYHAAVVLFRDAKEKGPLAFAPARLCAIHAIELCLNAFLRHEGSPPGQIRARMHNLADPRFVAALKLREKTARHLADVTETARIPDLALRPGSGVPAHRVEPSVGRPGGVMTKLDGHLRATGTGGSA